MIVMMPATSKSALISIATVLRSSPTRGTENQRNRDAAGVHDEDVLKSKSRLAGNGEPLVDWMDGHAPISVRSWKCFVYGTIQHVDNFLPWSNLFRLCNQNFHQSTAIFGTWTTTRER